MNGKDIRKYRLFSKGAHVITAGDNGQTCGPAEGIVNSPAPGAQGARRLQIMKKFDLSKVIPAPREARLDGGFIRLGPGWSAPRGGEAPPAWMVWLAGFGMRGRSPGKKINFICRGRDDGSYGVEVGENAVSVEAGGGARLRLRPADGKRDFGRRGASTLPDKGFPGAPGQGLPLKF